MPPPGGERTEAATPRRREEARQQGQVARSAEISAIAGLLAGMIALRLGYGSMLKGLQEFTSLTLSRAGTAEIGVASLRVEALGAALAIGKVAGPFMLAICVGGVIGNLLQVGFMFNFKPLMPKWDKLNIIQGIPRLFSMQALVGLGKSLVKAIVIGVIIYSFMKANMEKVIGLAGMGLGDMGKITGQMMWELLVKSAIALLVIAALDYLYQRFQHEKNLRMTKTESKEEYKRTEGDPFIRMRRRQRHREIARHRMMQAVRNATVVVTNPTHIAVALRYAPKESLAPVLVAKGERLIAEKIKEIAGECRIPVIENVPLARALHKSVKLGQQVPPELYQAVAEVLAFVYKMSGKAPVLTT